MTTGDDPPSEALIDRLEQLSTPVIADTKHEGVDVLSPAIEPIHHTCEVVGTARTVRLDPAMLCAPVQTLEEARKDEVVVVDTGDCVEEAIWGELLSTYASTIGVVGLVTDGAVRDIAGIRDLGFPTFARARTPRGPSGNEETSRNVGVTVGGAPIEPGDVIVGDETGVVVLERDGVDEIVQAAESIHGTEREVKRRIDDGESLERAFTAAGM